MLPSQETLNYMVDHLEITRKKSEFDIPKTLEYFLRKLSPYTRRATFTDYFDVFFTPKDKQMEKEMLNWYDKISGGILLTTKGSYSFSNDKIMGLWPIGIIYSRIIKSPSGLHIKEMCKFRMSVDNIKR
jgi:hypothetical protein